jgi:hypothetical protein
VGSSSRAAPVVGTGARYHGTQTGGGDTRGKDQALQIARTELARVSRLTTLGELTTIDSPRGQSAAGGDGEPALGHAHTGWKPTHRRSRKREWRSTTSWPTAKGRAKSSRAYGRSLRRQAPRKEPLDINQEIVRFSRLLKHELGSQDVVLRTDLGPSPLNVAGDRVQLQSSPAQSDRKRDRGDERRP